MLAMLALMVLLLLWCEVPHMGTLSYRVVGVFELYSESSCKPAACVATACALSLVPNNCHNACEVNNSTKSVASPAISQEQPSCRLTTTKTPSTQPKKPTTSRGLPTPCGMEAACHNMEEHSQSGSTNTACRQIKLQCVARTGTQAPALLCVNVLPTPQLRCT